MRRTQNIALLVAVLLVVFGVGYFRGRKLPPTPVDRYSLAREKARQVFSALPTVLARAAGKRDEASMPPRSSGATDAVSLGGDLRVNGLPMSISTYETERSVEDVLAEVRDGMRGAPETIVTSLGEGQGYVSQIDPATMQMTTVLAMAQPDGKTRVIPAVTEAGAQPRERRVDDFPLQSPSLHAFHLEATDGGRRSDTFTFQRPDRPGAAMSWVLGQMQGVGWTPDPRFRSAARKRNPDAENIFLTRGSRECTITSTPAGDSRGSDVVVILADGVR